MVEKWDRDEVPLLKRGFLLEGGDQEEEEGLVLEGSDNTGPEGGATKTQTTQMASSKARQMVEAAQIKQLDEHNFSS